jgi:hypothetical protein
LNNYVLADIDEELPDLACAFPDLFLVLLREQALVSRDQVLMVVPKSFVEIAVLDQEPCTNEEALNAHEYHVGMPPLDRFQDGEGCCIDHEECDTSPKLRDLFILLGLVFLLEVFEKYLPPVYVA